MTFLIGALALAGLPPFSLWLTKDAILAAALEASPALYAAGLLGAVLSAAYSAKIIAVVWAAPQRDTEQAGWDAEQRGTRHIPTTAIWPLAVLAFGAATLGVLAVPGLDTWFRETLGASTQPQSTPWELIASAVLALLAVLVVFRYRLPVVPWAAGWFGLEGVAMRTIGRPTDALAGALARFNDRLDAAIDAAPRALDRTGGVARSLDDGVDDTVGHVVQATRAAGRLARGSQSGRVADYYAAGALVTVAFVILLIGMR